MEFASFSDEMNFRSLNTAVMEHGAPADWQRGGRVTRPGIISILGFSAGQGVAAGGADAAAGQGGGGPLIPSPLGGGLGWGRRRG